MFHKLDKLSNSVGDDLNPTSKLYTNFRKNKRTASVADSQTKRGFSNSMNLAHLDKENVYRYMSVTPSHKYHESKKDKLFASDTSVINMNSNFLKTSTQRI